jgi:hypothetical protein
MTTTDYLINFVLIGLVVLQIRGRRLDPVSLLLPLGIVAWVAVSYLHGFPTAGNDLVLEIGGLAVGAALGLGCAAATRIERRSDGAVIVKAGAVAAGLWILGVGSRLAFEIASTHGGGAAIGRFSVAHDITSGQAWVDALVLMAIAEVAGRTFGVAIRAWRGRHSASPVSGVRPVTAAGVADAATAR